MIEYVKRAIEQLFRSIGLELSRITVASNFNAGLVAAFNRFEIDTVLDVGANSGQFSTMLRQAGFKGDIISFEPLSEAYAKLIDNSKKDPKWKVCQRGALGDYDGETTINISGNSVSSSILDIKKMHTNAAKESSYVGSETINVYKLDSLADKYISKEKNIFLKIDTQGFESQVLDGAVKTLPMIQGVLLETSLVELYAGQSLWKDMIERLENEGFTVWTIDRGFTDPRDGRTLQCDIAFFKN